MKTEKPSKMRKGQKIRHYTLTFKHQTIREMEANGMGVPQASRHYGVPSNTIRDWVKLYGSLPLPPKDTEVLSKEASVRLSTLEEENRLLRRAVEESKKKVIALETLIDVAEEELSIKIRKKSVTKQ